MLCLITNAAIKYYLPLREEIRICEEITTFWAVNERAERRAKDNPSFQKQICHWM